MRRSRNKRGDSEGGTMNSVEIERKAERRMEAGKEWGDEGGAKKKDGKQ